MAHPLHPGGNRLVLEALAHGTLGPYQLQAAIAAVHAEAPRAQDTDWRQILGLYQLLERVAPSPVVTLNRAIAKAMVEGPGAGLDLLGNLDGEPLLRGQATVRRRPRPPAGAGRRPSGRSPVLPGGRPPDAEPA